MVDGYLHAEGTVIQGERVRQILATVDPVGTASRWGRAINRRVCAVPKRLVAHGCSYEADQVCIMLIILKVAKYHNNNNYYYYFISGAKKAHIYSLHNTIILFIYISHYDNNVTLLSVTPCYSTK